MSLEPAYRLFCWTDGVLAGRTGIFDSMKAICALARELAIELCGGQVFTDRDRRKAFTAAIANLANRLVGD